MITNDAILLGGGVGRRFSDGPSELVTNPKQFQLVDDLPVFIHSLHSLLQLGCLRQVVIVIPKAFMGLAREQLSHHLPQETRLPIQIIAGGERRQDSSRIALEFIGRTSPLPTRVLIHDACRPFLSAPLLTRIRKALLDRSFGAWIPAVPVTDTLKRVENRRVVETIDRSTVWQVQTPQIFEYSMICALHQKAKNLPADFTFTDDASLCEYDGVPVGIFDGDVRNLKLTYEFELRALQSMIIENKDASCALDSATTFTV